MNTARLLHIAAELLEPAALRAVLTTPGFSLASYRIMRRLEAHGISPRTILDVGANTGQFSLAAVRAFPDAQVYAFEPVPECAAVLRQRAAGHSILVDETAIGATDEMREITVNNDARASSLLALGSTHIKAFPHATASRRVHVRVKTLDNVTAHLQMDAPVLLKLDVQGFEKFVIAGATRTLRHVDYLLAETSFEPLYDGEWTFPEMFDVLRDLGFTMLGPLDYLSSGDGGRILQMDALFKRES